MEESMNVNADFTLKAVTDTQGLESPPWPASIDTR